MNDRSLNRLRSYHRLVAWEGAVWILAAALAVDLALVLSGRGSRFHFTILVGGIAIAGAVRGLRRQPLSETACAVDAAMGSRNRFEAVAEVAGRTDALAEAIRTEASRYLSGRSTPRPYRAWLALAVVAGLLVCHWLGPVTKVAPRAQTKTVAAAIPAVPQLPADVEAVPPPPVIPRLTPAVHFTAAAGAKPAPGQRNPAGLPAAHGRAPSAPSNAAAVQKLLDEFAALESPAGAGLEGPAATKGTAGGKVEPNDVRLGRLTGTQMVLDLKIAQGATENGILKAENNLAKELNQFAAQAGLPTAVAIHLRNAAADAHRAAQQLAAGDAAAANEPAARAALSLKQAQIVMGSAQRNFVDRALQKVQTILIQASGEVQGPEESNRGAIAASQLTALSARVLVQVQMRLQAQVDRQTEQDDRAAMQSGNDDDGTKELRAEERRQAQAMRRGYDPASALKEVDDIMDAYVLSHIQWDLGDLIKAGDRASASGEAAAADTLMKLAQMIADRMVGSNDPRHRQIQAAANLRTDQGQGGAGSAAVMQQRQVRAQTIADVQVATSVLAQSPAPDDSSAGSNPSPGDESPGQSNGDKPGKDGTGGHEAGKGQPPNPPKALPPSEKPGTSSGPGGPASGSGLQSRVGQANPKELRQQSEIGIRNSDPQALNKLAAGLIQQLDAAAAQKPRTSTLTIGNPAEAPPAYRSAVADYFESLARDPAPAVPPKP